MILLLLNAFVGCLTMFVWVLTLVLFGCVNCRFLWLFVRMRCGFVIVWLLAIVSYWFVYCCIDLCGWVIDCLFGFGEFVCLDCLFVKFDVFAVNCVYFFGLRFFCCLVILLGFRYFVVLWFDFGCFSV